MTAYCRCSHPVDHHEHYSRSTQCTSPTCDCPRPVNENWRCGWQAALILVGLLLGMVVLQACMGGAA